jgi:hypothetical protein
VTRQGTIFKDATPIIIRKAKVIPEVWPDPLPSLNEVQCMINSTLERQEKSTDKLLCRLIEERDGKKLETTSVNPSSSSYTVSFIQTNPQISDTLVDAATMPNSLAKPMNHFHSRTTIEGSTPTFRMSQ